MSISEELNKLIETKEAIRQSIIAKGTDVGTDVPFSQYPSKINEIQTGSGGSYMNPEFYEMRTNGGTNFAGLFARTAGYDLDLTNLDTSKAESFSYMFDNCSVGNIDCSGWDTSNVHNMTYTFYYFYGGIDINHWVFKDGADISYMFGNAKVDNIKLNNLTTNSLKSLNYMFNSASGTILDLSNWDISNVTSMNSLFYNSKFKKIDLTNWNTSKVTSMNSLFCFAYNSITEELIIPDWDMTNTTIYSTFFGSGSAYTTKLKYIDLGRSNELTITRIASCLPTRTETTYGDVVIPSDSSQTVIDALIAKYWRPVGPKLDLVSCEIVAELDEVLLGKTTKIHIGNCNPWYGDMKNNIEYVVVDENVASVDENGILTTHSLGSTDIYVVLKDTRAVISNTITITVAETDSNPYTIKFRGANPPNNLYHYIYVNGTNSENKVLLSSMDYNSITGIYTYDAGEPINHIKFNAYGSPYTDSKYTCKEIIKINTSNMTGMYSMFSDCTELISLDTSNWDTSNVTDMSGMFYNCTEIISLDVSNWDTSNVEDITKIFGNCNKLTSITCNVIATINKLASQLPSSNGTIYTTCNPADLDLTTIESKGWTVQSSYQA